MNNLSSDEIKALSTLAKSGDNESFNILWEEYKPAVLNFIQSQMRVCSFYAVSSSEDILHNTWEYLRKKICNLDLNYDDSFRKAMYTSSRYMVMQYIRKAKKESNNIFLDDEEKMKFIRFDTKKAVHVSLI